MPPMPSAVRLPPRSALRRDVEIPVLPGLGLTWYDRGPRYWARRAGLTFMWALPEPPAERQARLWMAARLRERGYELPAG
jgi:hypothetical protein